MSNPAARFDDGRPTDFDLDSHTGNAL